MTRRVTHTHTHSDAKKPNEEFLVSTGAFACLSPVPPVTERVCPSHVCKWEGRNIRNPSQYNAVEYGTAFNHNLSNKHVIELTYFQQRQQKLNILTLIELHVCLKCSQRS